jgi:GrpB-like predicted nucleotidyltransferase (UPF0157 family)/truncated hemoglobin YjbI
MSIETTSLYDILGGQETISAVVEEFYQRILADASINHYFSHLDMEKLYTHQTAFVTQILGGPNHYEGRSMHETHQHLHLVAALECFKVPQVYIDAVMSKVARLEREVLGHELIEMHPSKRRTITASKPYKHTVEVVDYNPQWQEWFVNERDKLLNYFLELEHMGSTAIPGQRAKPIIDMMAAVKQLDDLDIFLPELEGMGYQLFDTRMSGRHFLSKVDTNKQQTFHLHIVEYPTWATRKERLMCDYLLKHPEDVEAYGQLKDELAQKYRENSLSYTEGKTDFIQGIMNKIQDELGLPHIDVWED